jgi:hypothetical protein
VEEHAGEDAHIGVHIFSFAHFVFQEEKTPAHSRFSCSSFGEKGEEENRGRAQVKKAAGGEEHPSKRRRRLRVAVGGWISAICSQNKDHEMLHSRGGVSRLELLGRTAEFCPSMNAGVRSTMCVGLSCAP